MLLRELIKCVKGAEVSGEDVEVLGVCEDSRKVRAGDVFVARRGTKVKGMAFVREAIERGAVVIVSEEEAPRGSVVVDIPWVKVPDANLAAALLYMRSRDDRRRA